MIGAGNSQALHTHAVERSLTPVTAGVLAVVWCGGLTYNKLWCMCRCVNRHTIAT